jgi:hypothetical protein
MRAVAFVAALLIGAGCTKLNEGTEEARERQPVTPPGIAPLDGLDGGRAAGGNSPAAGQPAPSAGGQRQGIIGKTTNQVVDLHKAQAENPNLVIVEQRAQGDDPVSFALRAYVDVRSRASTFGMTRAVQLYQAEHERWPSYDEFVRMMRENRVEFTMIEPFRMYAYDSKTGEIVVLEDPDEKRRRYEAAGLSVD